MREVVWRTSVESDFLCQTRFRISQTPNAAADQAIMAVGKISNALWLGRNRQTNKAKTSNPMLPIADPAESTLAAFLPRVIPLSPALLFFCFSCFSTRVALAGKIAGNARKSPPITGPNFLATTPAAAVINPPRTNRTAYSCHFVRPRDEVSISTCIAGYLSHTRHKVNAAPPHIGMQNRVTHRALAW